MVYRKDVESIDEEGGWEHSMSEDAESWREVHSCVDDSGNAWGLLEAADLLGMCVQNTQLGDIIDKSTNRR